MSDSNEAQSLLLRLYDAMSTGSNDAIAQLFSPEEVLLIGSDPKEWLPSYRSIIDTLTLQMQEMGGSIPVQPREPTGFSGTDMGWAADRPSLRLPDGTEIQTRVSIVGKRGMDGWKIVHLHLSLGVGNEESFGQDLSVTETGTA
jgi:SnoaL-like domain